MNVEFDAGMRRLRLNIKCSDNLATAHPIYVVQEKERIYGDYGFSEDSDVYVWVDDEGHVFCENEDPKVFGGDDKDFTRRDYIEVWKFVQPFFSDVGANAFIASNKHNLSEPRVYVMSAYGNREWQTARALLRGDNLDV